MAYFDECWPRMWPINSWVSANRTLASTPNVRYKKQRLGPTAFKFDDPHRTLRSAFGCGVLSSFRSYCESAPPVWGNNFLRFGRSYSPKSEERVNEKKGKPDLMGLPSKRRGFVKRYFLAIRTCSTEAGP